MGQRGKVRENYRLTGGFTLRGHGGLASLRLNKESVINNRKALTVETPGIL